MEALKNPSFILKIGRGIVVLRDVVVMSKNDEEDCQPLEG